MSHFGPDIEEQLRRKAERLGQASETALLTVIERRVEDVKRQPLDEWIALLHQAPPVGAPGPDGPMTREALRRENLYEG